MQSSQDKRILIVGGGIIGASVAYHLSLKSKSATVVEQCEPACAASGKSGGFLAEDWCDGSQLKTLARPSFHMHEEYSRTFGNDIGYRRLESYSVSVVNPESRTARHQKSAHISAALSWIDGNSRVVGRTRRMGSTGTNAQVIPKQLTLTLLEKAKQNAGTEVKIGRVEDIRRSGNTWTAQVHHGSGELKSYEYDIVVLCMGPWTIKAQKWFPSLPPIMAEKAASLVVKTKLPATALFAEYVNSRSEVRGPEIYPREDEVYMCQTAVPEVLPDDPAAIEIVSRDVADLKEFGAAISSKLGEALRDDARVMGQACNLPISPDGLPIIGSIPDTDKSAFVAAGHSCWGILNSPATGKAIAEMIVSGLSSIDITSFSPSRFR